MFNTSHLPNSSGMSLVYLAYDSKATSTSQVAHNAFPHRTPILLLEHFKVYDCRSYCARAQKAHFWKQQHNEHVGGLIYFAQEAFPLWILELFVTIAKISRQWHVFGLFFFTRGREHSAVNLTRLVVWQSDFMCSYVNSSSILNADDNATKPSTQLFARGETSRKRQTAHIWMVNEIFVNFSNCWLSHPPKQHKWPC